MSDVNDMGDGPVRLDLSTSVELTAAASLDLDEEWVVWLDGGAECPGNVEGIDHGVSYADDEAVV